MPAEEARSFATPKALDTWLRKYHATETELFVRMFKKGSGTPSVTWEELVVACLTWGWIDGVRRSLDDVSFVQRITQRKARSSWSKRNCEHAERLIREGRMQPSGMAHVEAARADGRWAKAYAGSAEMELPEDFLRALDARPVAKAFFAELKRAEVFSIYHRLHTAKRPETRARRLAVILEALSNERHIR